MRDLLQLAESIVLHVEWVGMFVIYGIIWSGLYIVYVATSIKIGVGPDINWNFLK